MNERDSSSPVNGAAFEDHYETLQLSPNADRDTIEKVYRILAKRHHPDNPITGDSERFTQLRKAFTVLSNPELRAAYDVKHSEVKRVQWQVFDQNSAESSFEDDKRIFQGILSLLYVARRQDVDEAGLGIMHLEEMLACPAEHLEFHLWYLKQKGWIQRQDNGQFAITVSGIERLMEGDLVLRRDRLISEKSADSNGGTGDARYLRESVSEREEDGSPQ